MMMAKKGKANAQPAADVDTGAGAALATGGAAGGSGVVAAAVSAETEKPPVTGAVVDEPALAADAGGNDPPAPAGDAGASDGTETLNEEARAANMLAAVTQPGRFRKRAVVVDAIRADGSPESNRAIIDWTRDSTTPAFMDKRVVDETEIACLSISTLEGTHWVSPGDYVVRGVAGEHYPVKPEIFHELYDPSGNPDDGQATQAAQAGGEDPAAQGDGDPDGAGAGGDESPADADRGDGGAAPHWPAAGNAWDQNVMHAVFAAGHVGVEFMFLGVSVLDEWQASHRPAHLAAAFLRANPGAPSESMAVHLRLRGIANVPDPVGLMLTAWQVFALVLRDLDAFDREQEAEAAERLATDAARRGPYLRPDGAFTPSAGGAFDAVGTRPR